MSPLRALRLDVEAVLDAEQLAARARSGGVDVAEDAACARPLIGEIVESELAIPIEPEIEQVRVGVEDQARGERGMGAVRRREIDAVRRLHAAQTGDRITTRNVAVRAGRGQALRSPLRVAVPCGTCSHAAGSGSRAGPRAARLGYRCAGARGHGEAARPPAAW